MAKIGIIGAGQVGASCAFALAQAGVAEEIALADIKTEKAAGEALDIAHGVPLLPAVRVTGGGYAEIDGADVVVMTAGANQAPNETRRDLLLKNLSVMAGRGAGNCPARACLRAFGGDQSRGRAYPRGAGPDGLFARTRFGQRHGAGQPAPALYAV